MARVIEESGLSTRREESAELSIASAVATAQHEIQSAIVVARNFPRNEDQCFERLMKACKRTSFAEDAAYSFPRGGTKVTGPSVNVAREAARVWGNIRYGQYVVRDSETGRKILGFAWDLETNTKIEAEDEFEKLVYRKKEGWIKPDERDLRELTNRRGAILVRNCLLQLLPKDLIEDAMNTCASTLEAGAAQDPDAARKKIILAFSDLNVTPEMLEKKLGHPLSESTPKEIAELRTIYSSIRDGNSTWHEYIEDTQEKERPASRGKLDLKDLKASKEENRGHGGENLNEVKAATPATAREPEAKQEPPKPAQKDPEPPAAPDPESACTQDQFTVLDDMKLEKDVDHKDVLAFVKTKLGYKMFSHLKNKDYERVYKFIENGAKE